MEIEVLHSTEKECQPPKPFEEDKSEVLKDEANKYFDDEALVVLMKEYPAIWDSSNKGYREKEVRKEAWIGISNALNKDVDTIKKRWKNLRDGMVRCLKKLDHSQHPGSGYLKTPVCRLFNQLLFLRDCVQCSNTSISFSDNEDSFATASTCQAEGGVSRKRLRCQDDPHTPQDKYNDKHEIYLTNALPVTNGYSNFDKPDVESSDWLFCKSLVGIMEKMPSKSNRKARIEILQVLMKYEFEEDAMSELNGVVGVDVVGVDDESSPPPSLE